MDWVVDGTVYSDPLEIAFDRSGNHDVVMRIYDPTGSFITRLESLQVTVTSQTYLDIEPVVISNSFQITWHAESGTVYQVQETLVLSNSPAWIDVGPPYTSSVYGPMNFTYTGTIDRVYFRLMREN